MAPRKQNNSYEYKRNLSRQTIFLEHKDAPGGRERDLAAQVNTVPQQMKFSAYHRPPLHLLSLCQSEGALNQIVRPPKSGQYLLSYDFH